MTIAYLANQNVKYMNFFWIFWSIDAVIALIFFYFFFCRNGRWLGVVVQCGLMVFSYSRAGSATDRWVLATGPSARTWCQNFVGYTRYTKPVVWSFLLSPYPNQSSLELTTPILYKLLLTLFSKWFNALP